MPIQGPRDQGNTEYQDPRDRLRDIGRRQIAMRRFRPREQVMVAGRVAMGGGSCVVIYGGRPAVGVSEESGFDRLQDLPRW